jgi:hypothetical protein
MPGAYDPGDLGSKSELEICVRSDDNFVAMIRLAKGPS